MSEPLIPTMFLRFERRRPALGWPPQSVLQQMWLDPWGGHVWKDVQIVEREEPQPAPDREHSLSES